MICYILLASAASLVTGVVDNSTSNTPSSMPSSTRAAIIPYFLDIFGVIPEVPATQESTSEDIFVKHANVWTDNQCGRVGHPWTESLSECKSRCMETTGCNAIEYKHDRFNVCVHRNCTQPVPRPTWKAILYKGYSLIKDKFVEHANVWTDNQCSRIGNPWIENLSECMNICKITIGCNAMDYKQDRVKVCVLRACNGSVPTPTWKSMPYKGYSLIKGSPTSKVPNTPALTTNAPATWTDITSTSTTTTKWMAITRSLTKQKPTSEKTNAESISYILISSIMSIIFIGLLFIFVVLYIKKRKDKDQQERTLVDTTSEQSLVVWIKGCALVRGFERL